MSLKVQSSPLAAASSRPAGDLSLNNLLGAGTAAFRSNEPSAPTFADISSVPHNPFEVMPPRSNSKAVNPHGDSESSYISSNSSGCVADDETTLHDSSDEESSISTSSSAYLADLESNYHSDVEMELMMRPEKLRLHDAAAVAYHSGNNDSVFGTNAQGSFKQDFQMGILSPSAAAYFGIDVGFHSELDTIPEIFSDSHPSPSTRVDDRTSTMNINDHTHMTLIGGRIDIAPVDNPTHTASIDETLAIGTTDHFINTNRAQKRLLPVMASRAVGAITFGAALFFRRKA